MRMTNGASFGSAHQLDLFAVRFCKCGQIARHNKTNCKPCHAASMREWRKFNTVSDEQRVKCNARSYANVYLRRGKITPQPCSVAGCMEKPQMHHDDYSKPLDVEWMCRKHHLQHHGKLLYLPA